MKQKQLKPFAFPRKKGEEFVNFPDSKILCIDPDPYTEAWIRKAFRNAKIRANLTSVKTGREAFSLLTEEGFDLCILEYALPDMTGPQLCALLRQMGCDVPIMFFTVMSRPVDRQKAENAGANQYLCKPDDLDIFDFAVAHFLGKNGQFYSEKLMYSFLSKAA